MQRWRSTSARRRHATTRCSTSTSTSSRSSTTRAGTPPATSCCARSSALLRPRLREGDTLARLGGDEFGVLLEHCAPEPALRIAEKLRTTIGDFRFVVEPALVQRRRERSASSTSRDGPRTLAGVLSAADAACYMAKDKGRNRVQVYSPESRRGRAAPRRDGMGEPHPSRARREPLLPLRAAGRAVRAATTAAAVHRAAAAPARRRRRGDAADGVHPGGRALQPDAGDRPLGDPHRVRAARASSRRRRRRRHGVYAINLSGASIGDDGLPRLRPRRSSSRFAIPHAAICFEITETTAVTSLSKATEFMLALRATAAAASRSTTSASACRRSRTSSTCRSITSRSTAASSRTCCTTPSIAAMVEAIHRIGHMMGKQTIAESVEIAMPCRGAARASASTTRRAYGIAMPAPFAQSPGAVATLPRRATG